MFVLFQETNLSPTSSHCNQRNMAASPKLKNRSAPSDIFASTANKLVMLVSEIIDNVVRNCRFHKNSLSSGLSTYQIFLFGTKYTLMQTETISKVKFVLLWLLLFTKFTFLKAWYSHYITVSWTKNMYVKYGRVLLTVVRLIKVHASNVKKYWILYYFQLIYKLFFF